MFKAYILLVLFVSNMNYGLPVTFLPTDLQEKGVEPIWLGIIFSVFSMTSFYSSLWAGDRVDLVGHTKMVTGGSVVLAVSVFIFGLVDYLSSRSLVIFCALSLRSI